LSRVRRRVDGRGSYSNAFLGYVERQAGPEGLARALRRSGFGPDRVAEVLAGANLRIRELIACHDAAVEECGDAELGRRVGEELFRLHRADGVADALVGMGDIRAAFDLVVSSTNSMTRARRIDVVEADGDHLVVEATYEPGAEAHRMFCGLTAGYYAAVPGLFGADGAAGEPQCVLRGDPTCRFRLTWTEPDTALDGGIGFGGEIERSRRRIEGFFQFVEELLAAAAELAVAPDLQSLLDRVARSAGITMAASEFVVAVRAVDGGPLHHAAWGVGDPHEAARLAEDLLRGQGTEVAPSATVVDIASPARHWGRLAAYSPGGIPHEVVVRALEAYAGVASATLERLSALDAAAADRDVARALLDLAGAVDADDVVDKLSAAVVRATGCRHASVWRWAGATRRLELASRCDRGEPAALPRDSVAVPDDVKVKALIDRPEPFVLPAAITTGEVREVLDALGMTHAFVVPIVVRGELLGLVLARSGRQARSRRDLEAALVGITDQATTALDNARLLETVRRQALQDGLTGLANRSAIEDEVRACLVDAVQGDAPVALLFVDLDRFKAVNDTYGHHAGDDLIRQVAERLRTSVREGDTVARLGGDEFLVLCRGVVDPAIPARVEARITEALSLPFNVQGEPVVISCSVGAAAYPDDGTDYDTLLRRADAAMYRAKAG
jgi:diguanylate cyclase (GGDEF)-like protein